MFGYPMNSKTSVNQDSEAALCVSRASLWARRSIYFGAVTFTTIFGIGLMLDILSANGMNFLEWTLLVLFSLTYTWIVLAFWNAVIGFFLQMFKVDPLTLKWRRAEFDYTDSAHDPHIRSRTAVVMPIYNEDTRRVIAGLEANLRSLQQTGQLAHFDFFLLSDTQDAQLAQAELGAWQCLRERLGALQSQVFYRRRLNNEGRKVGNLTDFCQRWGSQYEHMIVLDADSLMTGQCMLSLVKAMEANPTAGLIQTVPVPVRQHTFFGRFLQFAADVYSPMLATGLAFWQVDSANYWGHNAILRTSAFMDHCGLPPLPGRAPFGGEILSHDFVEAALLRRAGWHVILLPELKGSFEEVPSNILDYATRDRRWVQGNIQHLGLLFSSGLHSISRLHFFFGAVAYLSTLIWMAMLTLSTVDAITRALATEVFFSGSPQLFPDWPVIKIGLIHIMLYLTAGLLLLPKLMGLLVAAVHHRKAFGGLRKLLAGGISEVAFAILVAPLMMVFHSYFVVCVLLGRKVSWNAQGREGRMVPWRDALLRTSLPAGIAVIWGSLAYYFTPMFFWWLVPVLAGLVCAAPIVRYSSSLRLGRGCRTWGIFTSRSEVQHQPVLADLDNILKALPEQFPINASPPSLPEERWRTMPIQSFGKTPYARPKLKVS